MNEATLRILLGRTGLRYDFIAGVLGISKSSLTRKVSGLRGWRPTEVADLHKTLRRYGVIVSKKALAEYCGLSHRPAAGASRSINPAGAGIGTPRSGIAESNVAPERPGGVAQLSSDLERQGSSLSSRPACPTSTPSVPGALPGQTARLVKEECNE